MKVLIGTPIHECKEYSIKPWLESVKNCEGNWFLYLVDNSPTPDFTERVSEMIKGMNAEVLHLENMPNDMEARLAPSREEIRKKFLVGDYDYWFSWECDIIAPPDTLKTLLSFTDQFDVVNHCYPDRDNLRGEIWGIGLTLYRRSILEELSFLENGGYGYCDPLEPSCYYGGDGWLVRRITDRGYKMIDLRNLLKVQHLKEVKSG